jgi:hypothetical protein
MVPPGIGFGIVTFMLHKAAIHCSLLNQGMWHRSHDTPRRLVLSWALIRHLPQQVVFGPGQLGDFHDLRSHPMHDGSLSVG